MKKVNAKISGVEEIKWTVNPGDLELELGKDQKVRQVFVFTEGKKLKQNFNLVGGGAVLELLIVFIGEGKDELFLSERINHLGANTSAKVGLKAILFGGSRIDFRGNIFVACEGHGTDTYLKCESLLMSERAVSRAIPSLEIIANDVKAGHAATVGRVDDDSLFYLESRGFDREMAEKLLLEAFLGEAGNFFSGLEVEDKQNIAEKLINLLPKS